MVFELFTWVRVLNQSKPSLTGPDELLARLIMRRVEAQALTLGEQRSNMQ
jgi:hypothetical protein